MLNFIKCTYNFMCDVTSLSLPYTDTVILFIGSICKFKFGRVVTNIVIEEIQVPK